MADSLLAAAEKNCKGVTQKASKNDELRVSLLIESLPEIDRAKWAASSGDRQAVYESIRIDGLPLGYSNSSSYVQVGRNTESIIRATSIATNLAAVSATIQMENRGLEQASAGKCELAFNMLSTSNEVLKKLALKPKAVESAK